MPAPPATTTTQGQAREQTMSASAHLFTPNHRTPCDQGHRCEHAAVLHEGRWWITFGHCAFNSGPNNRNGYATRTAALRDVGRHWVPAFRAKIEADHAELMAPGGLTGFDSCLSLPGWAK